MGSTGSPELLATQISVQEHIWGCTRDQHPPQLKTRLFTGAPQSAGTGPQHFYDLRSKEFPAPSQRSGGFSWDTHQWAQQSPNSRSDGARHQDVWGLGAEQTLPKSEDPDEPQTELHWKLV